MSSRTPPEAFWGPTGSSPTGNLAILELRVCKDPNGGVWSLHQPLTEADKQEFDSWPSHGVLQITHALLTEALRREAYMGVLIELTKDEAFVTKYQQADVQGKEQIEQMLSTVCQQVVNSMLPKMVPDVVKEILAMVSHP